MLFSSHQFAPLSLWTYFVQNLLWHFICANLLNPFYITPIKPFSTVELRLTRFVKCYTKALKMFLSVIQYLFLLSPAWYLILVCFLGKQEKLSLFCFVSLEIVPHPTQVSMKYYLIFSPKCIFCIFTDCRGWIWFTNTISDI